MALCAGDIKPLIHHDPDGPRVDPPGASPASLAAAAGPLTNATAHSHYNLQHSQIILDLLNTK